MEKIQTSEISVGYLPKNVYATNTDSRNVILSYAKRVFPHLIYVVCISFKSLTETMTTNNEE